MAMQTRFTGAEADTAIEPMPFALLDEPLEYLFADHFRQRSVCQLIRRFARTGSARRKDADRVAAFLQDDVAIHHEDEDNDLVPALRRRALPQDALGPVLARLAEDHRRNDGMVADIV
ncbi:MAG: hemerythrin domain-containing protein, partial [Beijerinckiaceae bacterium]